MAAKRNSVTRSERRRAAAAVPATRRRWGGLWIALCGAALALAAFGPALRGPFLFDDLILPFLAPHAAHMPVIFWIGGVRPLLMASYWLNYLLSGTQPFSYHLVNLLLHCATATVALFMLRELLALSGAPAERGWLALFGA